jgi:two-component sensor histidine kinase
LLGRGYIRNQRQRYAQALPLLLAAEPMLHSTGRLEHQTHALVFLAAAYAKLNRPARAIESAQRAIEAAKQTGSQATLAEATQALAESYVAVGNYKAAYAAHERARQLSDSAFTTARSRELYALEALYQHENRLKQIKTLRQRTELLNLRRNWLIGGLLLVGVMAALNYRRYRTAQRHHHVIRAQQAELNSYVQELTTTQAQLHRSLREKSALLKEVHHRVKNNLQIIAGLLAMQADEKPTARAALEEGQNWLKSIALIHELLYRSDDLSSIDFQQFSELLATHLHKFFDGSSKCIRYRVHAPNVRFGATTAIPLGLIINELLSNAYEHAFPQQPGCIDLTLEALPQAGCFRLVVADDGIGLPPNFTVAQSSALGLQLVEALAEQLDGHLQLHALATGTRIEIVFCELTEEPIPG